MGITGGKQTDATKWKLETKMNLFACLKTKDTSLKQNILLIVPEWTGYRAKGGRTPKLAAH